MTSDKDRLIGNEEYEITEQEVLAYQRGKDDLAKKMRLLANQSLNDKQIIKVIKDFARGKPFSELANSYSVSAQAIQRIFTTFEIEDAYQAKQMLQSGVLAEIITEHEAAINERRLEARKVHNAAERRLREIEAQQQNIEDEEGIRNVREQAEKRNREDAARLIRAKEMTPFIIEPTRESEFRNAIKHGVSYCQELFGGSRADIVKEAQRLIPELDAGMLRP